ncbi:hypothetical protein A3F28_00710 [Candidatus Uhrbacteria bacterium RIFCSPHIGHO2_12_FULL_57_11]|uniref:Uncharacterized protein n=1 Tax=Candidatus Uhrbacteria bacterium RIFCSPHIGHO2_12_FULL_57_11 TaxID=1802398 RepID=A0A1F7UNF0_9BACT|nr:MAG: hypothetical protein A3F28_00710 [Candidatus Uhrbacteria bacterium RIFCSPHIGHO2_12_FULL_57_11]
MARRSPESAAPFIPPTEEAAAVPPPEAEEVIELRKVKKPKKLTPEQEARFQEGLKKLREREEKIFADRKRESAAKDKLFQQQMLDELRLRELETGWNEIQEAATKAVEEREQTPFDDRWNALVGKVARESGFEELDQEPFQRFLEEKKSDIVRRAIDMVKSGEAINATVAMEMAAKGYRDEFEKVFVKGETAEVLKEIAEDKERKRAVEETAQKLKLDLEARGQLFDTVVINGAYKEEIKANGEAARVLMPEQYQSISEDLMELAWFEDGENPVILSNRETYQNELDQSAHLYGVEGVTYYDFKKQRDSLKSVEEGGKTRPAELKSKEDEVRATWEFQSKLHESFLTAIDRAHQEFPDAFPFTGKQYEKLVRRANDLEKKVKETKGSMGMGARVRRLFEGPSKDEIMLRAEKKQLAKWDSLVDDYVEAGRSTLSKKYIEQQRADFKSKERERR